MERKIGQIFSYGYEIYQVVKNDELHLLGCSGCCFITEDGCCSRPDIAGTCMANDRSDNTDVMFISIGNVNTKKNKNRRINYDKRRRNMECHK